MKYYKGLGSSTNEEARDSFSGFHNNMFAYRLSTENDDIILKKAFESDKSDLRKEMIRAFDGQYLDYENVREVSCE